MTKYFMATLRAQGLFMYGTGMAPLMTRLLAAEQLAANGAAASGNSALVSSAAGATAKGPWQNLLGGVRIKQVGDYWVKEVNPDASKIMAVVGRGTIWAAGQGLCKLGDMPSFIYKNGKIITRDVGKFNGSTWELGQIYIKGSWRLGTPMNDIRWSRNIGANGQVFDPALHPIQQGLYWGAAAVPTYYGGQHLYYSWEVGAGPKTQNDVLLQNSPVVWHFMVFVV